MLDELHVVNMGVIEDLTIQLGPGMTVISGETGAGKTLLVDALSLLSGSRADPGVVRTGSDFARVEARFVNGARETVAIRQIGSSDRSRSYIDGVLCRVGDLASSLSGLFHIYGQHEALALFSADAQGTTLDEFLGIDYSVVKGLRKDLRSAQERLARLGGDERSRQRELSVCQIEFNELEAADLHDPEEEIHLRLELDRLSNALEFRNSLESAYALLIEGDEAPSAMDLLGQARGVLQHNHSYEAIEARIGEQIALLRETGSELLKEREFLDPNPERLDQLHSRLHFLSQLKRRYGDTLAEVIDYKTNISKRLNELSSYELIASQTEQEIRGLEDEIASEEASILQERKAGGLVFSSAVMERLRDLAMPNARFAIDFSFSGVGDPISFMFSPNQGEKLAPVSKVASGGELSRIMLAIRLISASMVPTMVFDEVDAGIGGSTALSVGRALAELAKEKQVIVVTHLAQVAAFAAGQIAISKIEVDGRTVTIANPVSGDERVAELARMLSGHKDSKKARDHARELLNEIAPL